MLQIRLSKGSSGEPAPPSGAPSAASLPPTTKAASEGVTVACPDHLVIADLPVAKSLGAVTASAAAAARTIGRRSRRPLGERVHICSRCDFPVAIYGRLTPCEHAFCLTCARSDSSCYLCEERIQKIQSVKMMEGIFICAAPHCLKSFLKRFDFESHIQDSHSNLLNANESKRPATESDTQKDATLKPESSTARGPTPTSSSHQLQRENSNPKLEAPFMYPPMPGHQNFMPMNLNQQFFMNPYQMGLDPGLDPGSVMMPWGMGMMQMGQMGQMGQQGSGSSQMGQMGQQGSGNMEGAVSQVADQVHGGIGFMTQGDNSGDNKGVLANMQQMQLQMSQMNMPPQMPPASMQMNFNNR